MARSTYETLYKRLMNINEDGLSALRMALALMMIGVSARYPDRTEETTLSQRLGVGGHEEQNHWWILGTSPPFTFSHYRQRSWAKVIFLQGSVCPQGGICLSACWDAAHPLPDQAPPPGPGTPPGSRPPRQ